MGMAASQARYLQLSARMSNCEYEGQQINQQRTILANESANLFNQMLVMQVPTVPSSTDFTTVQYTFSDGTNNQVLDNYYQLGTPDSDYNYVVTHSYSVKRYTGSMKKLTDPQVQFTDISKILAPEAYEAYQQAIYRSFAEYQAELATYEQMKTDAESLITDVELAQVGIQGRLGKTTEKAVNYDPLTDIYSVTDNLDAVYELTPITEVNPDLEAIIKSGALKEGDTYFSYQDANGITNYLSGSAVQNYYNGAATGLTAYSVDLTNPDTLNAINNYDVALQTYTDAVTSADDFYNTTVTNAYNSYKTLLESDSASKPTYIGNCALTEIPVGQMTEDQLTELQQVIYDLAQAGETSNLPACFDANGNYKGGIYSFTMYGTTYYTTYDDLYLSYDSVDHNADSNNGIDRQLALSYYSAAYVDTNVSTTEKALLETDSSGRFVSIRLENDTVKYSLNAETVTDEAAYNDAMNEYYYRTAEYQKTVSDINAKTSIIQQEDRTLELRLEQLDTERNTLSTEMEAVQKVLSENIDRTYKTFSD